MKPGRCGALVWAMRLHEWRRNSWRGGADPAMSISAGYRFTRAVDGHHIDRSALQR